MNIFNSIKGGFARRTRKRVYKEILVFLMLLAFFFSVFSAALPKWLELSILVIYVIYIVIGLALYPIAKSTAENFTIYLLDDALGYSSKGSQKQLPYSDIVIAKVKKSKGKIIEIQLQTKFKQNIKLRDLENMGNLYEGLIIKGVRLELN